MATVRKIPMRKCTGCGQSKPKKELVRVLKTVDEQIVVDMTGKMNGRGAYICHSEECLKKAVKTKAIERSLGVSVSDDIYETLMLELGE
ncbi:MAG: YlxR family protein [Lachnospiraceae bacterium]|nr:YlxR family protein [Lachnospiraceae bacterium]